MTNSMLKAGDRVRLDFNAEEYYYGAITNMLLKRPHPCAGKCGTVQLVYNLCPDPINPDPAFQASVIFDGIGRNRSYEIPVEQLASVE